MLDIWRRVVIGSAVAVYLAGLGCAGGILVERLRQSLHTSSVAAVEEARP